MAPLSILHVITTLTRGGAENAVALLAKGQTKDSQVTVMPLKGELELLNDLEQNGVRVNLEVWNRNFLVQIFLLRKYLNFNSGFTTLHAHLPRAELLLALSSFWKPRFITRHNSEHFWLKAPKIFSLFLSRVATRRAKVICISKSVCTFLNTQKELSSKTFRKVIYYGYEPRFTEGRINRKFPLKDKLVLGTIARLTVQKNLNFLLDIASDLLQVGQNFEIKLLGAGPLEASLKAEVKIRGLDDYVKFYGRQQDVFPFLSSLDLFVLPSKYEGFGYVLLEAIDSGVPVFVSNIPVFHEVLGSKHPLYFDTDSTKEFLRLVEQISLGKIVLAELIGMQDSRLALFTIEEYLDSHQRLYLSLD